MKRREPLPEDTVRLKPIFGIRPERYIPIIYASLALILLFLAGFLPGIIHNGSVLITDSSVDELALWVDDVYIGNADEQHFIAKGSHQIRFTKPFFSTVEYSDHEVGGRVFATLISKRKMHLSAELRIDDLEGYLQWRLSELAAFSEVRNYSDNYFYPQTLLKTASDLIASDLASDPRAFSFFAAALGFITSEELLDDLDAALEMIAVPGFAILTDSGAYRLIDAFYRTSSITSLEDLIPVPEDAPRTAESLTSISIDGDEYSRIPSTGGILLGDHDGYARFTDLPFISPGTAAFYLQDREVSESDYAEFTRAVPLWRAENRDTLIEQQLVDEMYLEGVDLSSPSAVPIRNISYHAAVAYCTWRSTVLPYEITLPSAMQWETAAWHLRDSLQFDRELADTGSENGLSASLLGSVWEMCSDGYVPNANILTYDTASSDPLILVDPVRITVKGGSYVNDEMDISVRGAVPPYSCSPYIGFRTLAKELD